MNTPDPIDVAVGKQLRRIRRMQDLSLYNVSDALGISYQQVQKYERAANRISASKLVKLARYFNVPVESFFEHIDTPSEGENVMDDDIIKIGTLYSKLPGGYKKPLRLFMKSLISEKG